MNTNNREQVSQDNNKDIIGYELSEEEIIDYFGNSYDDKQHLIQYWNELLKDRYKKGKKEEQSRIYNDLYDKGYIDCYDDIKAIIFNNKK